MSVSTDYELLNLLLKGNTKRSLSLMLPGQTKMFPAGPAIKWYKPRPVEKMVSNTGMISDRKLSVKVVVILNRANELIKKFMSCISVDLASLLFYTK